MSCAGEGCFAIFDGGRNDEVAKQLESNIITLLLQEASHQTTHQKYMKYTMLSAHRSLKATGQKVGASAALCHLHRTSGQYILNVANVGDTEVVVCRRQEAICLTKKFSILDNMEECQRIMKSDGIVTEDGRVNGVTFCTRQLGCSYLFPHVIPDPHVVTTTLHPEDQLLIVANRGLWKYITYQEAINEIIGIPDPVVAAKRLQDLAQGYGSQENIAVLVVRLLLTDAERFRVKNILQKQFEVEQMILTQLKGKDTISDGKKKKRMSTHPEESVPMDIVKLKSTKKRIQVNELFSLDTTVDGVHVKPIQDEQQLSGLMDWEKLLQKRLTEEVKNKELKYIFLQSENDGMKNGDDLEELESNWSTLSKNADKIRDSETNSWVNKQAYYNQPPPYPHGCAPLVGSSESLAFIKELKMPLQVDRDAILFHEMQMARARNHSNSTDSMESTQSEQVFSSARENLGGRISSHSIEVLIHNPTTNNAEVSFGGSFPDNGTLDKNKKTAVKVGGSCPFTVVTENNPVSMENNQVFNEVCLNNSQGSDEAELTKENDVIKTISETDGNEAATRGKKALSAQEMFFDYKLTHVNADNFVYESSDSDNEPEYFSFPETKIVMPDIHRSSSRENNCDVHKDSVRSLEDLLSLGLQQVSVSSRVLNSDKRNSSSSELISSLSQQSLVITYL